MLIFIEYCYAKCINTTKIFSTKKGFAKILVLLGLLVALCLFWIVYDKAIRPKINELYWRKHTPTISIDPTSNPPRPPLAQNDETASWKTYTNSQYDFSFKYPQDSNYTIDSNLRDGIEISLKVPNNFTVYITAVSNSKNLSLDNPQQLFNNGPFTTDLGLASVTQTTLDGLKAFKADNCCLNHEFNFWAVTEIAAIKNQNVYEIRVESKEHTKQYPSSVNSKLLNQILSTFKFTN